VREASVPATSDDPERVRVADVVLDRPARVVRVRGDSLVLPSQEFQLLDLLMTNVDRVVPIEVILKTVWGADFHGDPGTVAVHVLRLRKRLERWSGVSRHLRTVRRIGYVFDTQPIASTKSRSGRDT
jgi:DNA-binding response OmpR family regulator